MTLYQESNPTPAQQWLTSLRMPAKIWYFLTCKWFLKNSVWWLKMESQLLKKMLLQLLQQLLRRQELILFHTSKILFISWLDIWMSFINQSTNNLEDKLSKLLQLFALVVERRHSLKLPMMWLQFYLQFKTPNLTREMLNAFICWVHGKEYACLWEKHSPHTWKMSFRESSIVLLWAHQWVLQARMDLQILVICLQKSSLK